MFNDFENSGGEEKSGGRRAASLGVAALLLLLLGSGGAAALAGVRVVERQREQEVSFADLPLPLPAPVLEVEPPPPPPPPRPARRDRSAGQRPVLDGPPSGIPDEIPEEADGELAETGNTGAIENDATMGDGGGGEAPVVEEPPPILVQVPVAPAPRPPEQVRETIRRARYLADRSGCRRIDIPDDIAASLGARTIRVRVRALVDTDGTVRSATVTNGHSLIPDELFIRCAEQWVFAPATLPDGTAVPYPAIRTFVIRPRT